MSRDEINIEIHRCFPIWSYPQDICPPDLIPPCNHGCWVQALTNRVQTVVQYADLLENSCHGVTPDTADLTVTDPCMCVFLLCVHAFRHYIEPPPKHLIAVQLGVLASIYELCQLPQFDKQQFEAFIDRFAGHDSVRFIGQLSAHFFGSDPLASAASQPAAQSGLASVDGWRCLPFPRSLTLFGCWACLNSADELLLPYDMAAVNQALVANTVVGTHEPARMRYSVFDDSVGEPISRMIVQAVEKRFIPFAFSVTWSKEALLFDVCILESLQKDHTYCLEIQDGVIKWQGTQLGEWPGGDGSGCVSLLENGCRFQVAFPWNVVWQQGRKSACKPFMLTLTKWPDTASYLWTAVLEAADPVITVPLNIIREP